MKRNKEDFFEQMKSYKTDTIIFDVICAGICLLSMSIALILINSVETGKIQLNKTILVSIFICIIIAALAILAYLTVLFAKNGIRFLAGDFVAGLKSLAIVVLPIYFILFIIYIIKPSWHESLNTAFTIITTIVVGVLTAMGVHYTVTKQQLAKNDEKNLIFSISEKGDELKYYSLSNANGNKSIQINLKNVSNNFGYLVGLYRLCGCDIQKIGDALPYLPIEPQSGYSISNIGLNLGDDQLLVVYKDISENHYYLLISSNYQYIESSGKCNMAFINARLNMTSKSEKARKDKIGQSTNSTLITDKSIIDYDKTIINSKEQTKPINIVSKDGFNLITSDDGEILTDEALLFKLRKERNRLSKENKLKAYMIFNNQQLVALATHKPKDELSFIAIYGLGKKKYDLYGSIFISIIADHERQKK